MLDEFTSELKTPNAATAAAIEEARNGGLPAFDSVTDLLDELNTEKLSAGL